MIAFCVPGTGLSSNFLYLDLKSVIKYLCHRIAEIFKLYKRRNSKTWVGLRFSLLSAKKR